MQDKWCYKLAKNYVLLNNDPFQLLYVYDNETPKFELLLLMNVQIKSEETERNR